MTNRSKDAFEGLCLGAMVAWAFFTTLPVLHCWLSQRVCKHYCDYCHCVAAEM